MAGEMPIVWVLEGLKVGDNAQARELAARLSASTEVKRLRYNWLCRLPNWLLGGRLHSVEHGRESLSAPWPDVVIGVGRRSVPVARWIRRQSGGRTRLVQMGRPRARLDIFDLVITTPQYGLPRAPNVVELTLPIVPEPVVPVNELEFWCQEFSELPTPRIAVLVGGPSPPIRMLASDMSQLVRDAEALRQRLGGSLIVVGSPRTPKDVLDEGAKTLTAPFRIFGWAAGRDNPYRAVLQIADYLVVTSDSVMMLAEAARTGKPVDVFRLPVHRKLRLPLHRWPFNALVRRGYLATRRDVDALMSTLIAEGHVGVLGGEKASQSPVQWQEGQVLERVNALIGR